jgi:hypothetical protein
MFSKSQPKGDNLVAPLLEIEEGTEKIDACFTASLCGKTLKLIRGTFDPKRKLKQLGDDKSAGLLFNVGHPFFTFVFFLDRGCCRRANQENQNQTLYVFEPFLTFVFFFIGGVCISCLTIRLRTDSLPL